MGVIKGIIMEKEEMKEDREGLISTKVWVGE